MKHPFNTLTKPDVQILRRKPVFVSSHNVAVYNFTSADIDSARTHLQTLYGGIIRDSFVMKILILNEIY